MGTPYKICAACGARLDPCEPCDCNTSGPERAVIQAERDAYGQIDRAAALPPSAYAETRKRKAADA